MIYLFLSLALAGPCEPPTTHYDIPNMDSGTYIRVHPEGKYIIVSSCTRTTTVTNVQTNDQGDVISQSSESTSNGACIVDLTKTPPEPPKVIPTQLNDESYPIEPHWDVVASPNHEKGTKMHYYRFKDLISLPKDKQKPIRVDDFNEFYHSAAMTSPGQARVMVWSDLRFQDFTVNKDSVRPTSRKGYACNNLLPNNFDFKRFNQVRVELQKFFETCNPSGEKAGGVSCSTVESTEIYKEYQALTSQLNLVLENPILSKDGREIGGLQNGKITIFNFENNGQCQIEEQLPFRGSKINFTYPVKGKKGQIAFLGDHFQVGQTQNNIYIYDRDLKKTFLVGQLNGHNMSYPGFTKDGRLIYLNMNKEGKSTIVSVDLKNFDFENCQVDISPKPNPSAQ